MMTVIETGFGGSGCLHELRAGAGGFADDIEFLVTPVRGHLSAAGAGIVLGAYSLKKGFKRSHAQREAERAVPVIRVNPIDAGTEKQAGRGGDRFMAGTGNLEINFVLAFELDFPVVKSPGEIHRAVDAYEGFAIEPLVPGRFQLCYFDACLYRHSVFLALNWKLFAIET